MNINDRVFRILMKSFDPVTKLDQFEGNLGLGIVFHPNLSSYSFRFHFRIVICVNFNSISVFRDFIFQKFHSCSFDDFFAKSDPNSVIFDSVDLSSSPLSKNIKLSNFYPYFIV